MTVRPFQQLPAQERAAALRSIGRNVARFRKASRLTQAELAALVGVANTHISALEHGRLYVGPRLRTRLAIALGVHSSSI